MKRLLVAFLFTPLVACPAWAANWNVDYAKSRLGFSVEWSNEPFTASFKSWKAAIDFDPADLAHARASVVIDMGSETSDEDEFDNGLRGTFGFGVAQFPTARFLATSFVRKSANDYVATGQLTIRGLTKRVTLPFTLAISDKSAHMTGTALVTRTDFGVGQGMWTAETPVAHAVTVTIDLFAMRS